jgi:aryl-alcohol dehydrogenase-like predicted oxidoreductase
MPYGTIPGLARPVSRLALGMGDLSIEQQGQAFDLLDAFVARGGTLVDTAPMYRAGGSERALGAWLNKPGRRGSVLVATKAGYWRFGDPTRLTAEEIAFDLGQSLERLGTDYVDLLLLHLDDPDVPPGPLVEALDRHRDRGRARAYGGSNWSPARLEAANAYAAARGLTPFAVGSPNLGLAVPREPMWPRCLSVAGDAESLAWYRRQRFPLLAWSSQANGFFSGRFAPGRVDDPDVARVYDTGANWERRRRAERLGTELGVTATQVALAWVLSQPGLEAYAVVGPRSTAELESSIAAAEIRLTPAQLAWLNLESGAEAAGPLT